MKSRNKGHEFDKLYSKIKSKKRFYLFGAGDYGRLFLRVMKDEINIVGFLDNNAEKQSKGY